MIDFNEVNVSTCEDLTKSLMRRFDDIASYYDIEIAYDDLKEKFYKLIVKVSEKTGSQVVKWTPKTAP